MTLICEAVKVQRGASILAPPRRAAAISPRLLVTSGGFLLLRRCRLPEVFLDDVG